MMLHYRVEGCSRTAHLACTTKTETIWFLFLLLPPLHFEGFFRSGHLSLLFARAFPLRDQLFPNVDSYNETLIVIRSFF